MLGSAWPGTTPANRLPGPRTPANTPQSVPGARQGPVTASFLPNRRPPARIRRRPRRPGKRAFPGGPGLAWLGCWRDFGPRDPGPDSILAGNFVTRDLEISDVGPKLAVSTTKHSNLEQEQDPLMAEGTIKRLTDKGFGFIDTGKGQDIFFHMSSVVDVSFEDLREGQKVSFTEGEGPKGPRAEDVKPID